MLLDDIRIHVDCAKTGFAALIEELDRRVRHFAANTKDFHMHVSELERRIGEHRRLIRKAEHESDKKHEDAMRLEEHAKYMDNERKKHETNAYRIAATALHLGFMGGMSCLIF